MTKIPRTSREIKTAVFDIDDTLRPQLEPLVEGLERARDKFARLFRVRAREYKVQLKKKRQDNDLGAGTVTLDQLRVVHSRMAKVNAEMIQQSMAEVFAKHGTTDYHYLFQEMKIFRWVFGDLDPDVFEIMKTEFVEIGKVVIRKVKNKKHYSSPFPGIPYLLKTLRENKIDCVAYSNAPIYQALDRLNRSNLLPFFNMVYGVRDEVGRVMPMLTETKVRLGEFGRNVKWRVVDPKPGGKLDEILEVSPDFVKNHVAVIGDSEHSDGVLALNNGCLFTKADWGGVDPDVQDRMGDFSNPEMEAGYRKGGHPIVSDPNAEKTHAETPYDVPKIFGLKK